MLGQSKKFLLVLGFAILSANVVAAEPPNQIKRFLDTSCVGSATGSCQNTWQGESRKPGNGQRMPIWLQMAFTQKAERPTLPSSISEDMRASYEQALAWQLVAANFKEFVRASQFKDLVEDLDALAERSKRLVSFRESKRLNLKLNPGKTHDDNGMAFGFDAGRMFSPTLSVNSKTKVVGDLQRQALLLEVKWNF